MVVAYRFGALTAFLLRTLGLVKVPYFSQPNLLVGRAAGAGVPAGAGERRRARRGAARRARRSRLPARARSTNSAAVHETLRRGGAAARGARPSSMLRASARRREIARELCATARSRRVAGVDEAGRGPLAGPVVAAAVILNPRRRIHGLADSKVLAAEERARLAPIIRTRALGLGGRLGRPRRDRQPQHPRRHVSRHAPRAAASAGVPDPRAGRRQQLPRARRPAARLHRARPSSRAMRASPRSAPPPFSPRRTAMP